MFAKLFGFWKRHLWSTSLASLSILAFAKLAAEMREGELDRVDRAIALAVQGLRGDADAVMLTLTHSGGSRGMTVLCLVSAAVLFWLRKRRESLFVLACGAGALLISTALKLLFQRARPDADLRYLIDAPNSFSFPSGHAMGSACVVGSLVVVACVLLPRGLRALAIVVGGAYVLGVATSRVYFGVHYPSDVIGGQLSSVAWVSAMTGWFYPRLLPGEAAKRPAPPSGESAAARAS